MIVFDCARVINAIVVEPTVIYLFKQEDEFLYFP